MVSTFGCVQLPAISKQVNDYDAARFPVSSSGSRSSSSNLDTLPPFSCLTNNIEREMKAECSSPGTYIVVFQPESFASLPEYAESNVCQPYGEITSSTEMGFRGEYSVSLGSSYSPIDDPDVVILPKFEDSFSHGCACRKAERDAALQPGTLGLTRKTDVECPYPTSEPSGFGSPDHLHTHPLTYAEDLPLHWNIDVEIQPDFPRLQHDLILLTAELAWLSSRWRLEDLESTGFCGSNRSERLNQLGQKQHALRQLWASSGMAFQEQSTGQLARSSKEMLRKVRRLSKSDNL